MLGKIHGTNFFHIKFSGRTNIKCQNGPVLPLAPVFILMVRHYTYSYEIPNIIQITLNGLPGG
jgi:hypothetical protein